MDGIRLAAVIGALALALTGCAWSGKKQDVTASVTGAPAATAYASEAFSSGLIGGAIGEELDAGDRRTAMDAEFRALEYGRTGAPIQWRGKSGRVYGDVVAGARYQVNDFACRGADPHPLYRRPAAGGHGTACRQADGTWKTVG